MRFDKIEEFKIEELLLDQGNYRFKKAKDQKACVRKIHDANSPYFKGLMKSIAEDDLGEPLLVYRNNGENIVSDGNRRLSALKVLHDTDYAPTKAVKEYADELCAKSKINFSRIHAQVSDNKKLVSRTVYERHSGGKNGTSRIPWNAYAAARFGYDEQIGDDKEWRIMALLSNTEDENPEITDFIDGSDFSYEVFRRLTRSALTKGIFSENIFSERGERIKKTARKDLVKDAINKAHNFLIAMQKKEITLSRKEGGIYADKENVEQYLNQFPLSPDNQELENAKSGSSNNSSDKNLHDNSTNDKNNDEDFADKTNSDSKNGQNSDDTDTESTTENNAGRGTGYGITKSNNIVNKINSLGSEKLKGLYKSLCVVSLNEHPQLMYVGAWSFLESLASRAGKQNVGFVGFFKTYLRGTTIAQNTLKDIWVALDDISKKGNANKHSGTYASSNALQLRNDFEILNPLVTEVLEKLISQKK